MFWKKLKPNPTLVERNPFQVYLLMLATFSGFTSLSTEVPSTSGSVANYLDGWHQVVWSSMLILGSVTCLVGMYWQGDIRDGLLFKRFGLTVLCVPVFIYGLIILVTYGISGLTVCLIIWGFSVASGLQAWRVNKQVRLSINTGDQDGRRKSN